MFKVKFPNCKACNRAVAVMDEKSVILPKSASIDARTKIVTFQTQLPIFAKQIVKEFEGQVLTV